MRVTLCVDALEPQLGGIGRYTWELCKRLPQSRHISMVQFVRAGSLIEDPAVLRRDEKYRPSFFRRHPRWLRKRRARTALRSGLVHGPNYFLPREAETGVITVHDLSVLRYPDMHPAQRVRAFDRLFASSLGRAAHVVTDTETVRGELIDAFSLAPGSVSAVPLGVDARFRPKDRIEVASAIEQWRLQPGCYGLSVAAFEPRKKIAELLAAWRRLPNEIRGRYPLVLAGGEGWHNQPLHEQISDAVSEGWLKHIGFVDEAHLPALYAGARLFLYPSVYEGFGLPPVEAMASGTPVVVANRSCLPEVCGEAAQFVDPDDPDSFTSVIEQCLVDQEWQSRAIARGLERAGQYNWDRCVAQTVEVYSKVYGEICRLSAG